MFDPGELTVKQVRARLCELDMDGLEEVLQAEIDGKHRSSLIAEVGRAIDMVKTAEESEAEEPEAEEPEVEEPEVEEAPVVSVEEAPVVSVEEAPVVPPQVAPVSVLTEAEWFCFPRHVRKDWTRQPDGTYVK